MTSHPVPVRRPRRRRSLLAPATALAATVAIVLSGCTGSVEGQATSGLNDPFKAGGLPAVDGPSGPRPDAPAPTGTVNDTDGGEIDQLASLGVNDIEEFWQKYYGPPLQGSFSPVDEMYSYDSTEPSYKTLCGAPLYRMVNAFFCPKSPTLIAWDRGKLLPVGQKYFGDMAPVGVLAHEYGHAMQYEGDLVDRSTPVIVKEQQADCFAGAYMRWVAEGDSKRFTLSTADGLNHVLAAAMVLADPVMTPDETEMAEDGHGSAFERISAFQMGFVTGIPACGAIDMDEIEQRRGDLPLGLEYDQAGDVETGEVPVSQESLQAVVDSLNDVFSPAQPPTVSFEAAASCPDAKSTPPASYCPSSNTISLDVPALQELGEQANEDQGVLIQGDDTAYSIVMSRYALAIQKEKGMELASPTAALRTACLAGAAHRRLSEPADDRVKITAGDLDEAVAGLLVNGMAATDVNGDGVPAGFARVDAFRAGVLADDTRCFTRFP